MVFNGNMDILMLKCVYFKQKRSDTRSYYNIFRGKGKTQEAGEGMSCQHAPSKQVPAVGGPQEAWAQGALGLANTFSFHVIQLSFLVSACYVLKLMKTS